MKLNLTEKDTCTRCGAKYDCGKSGKYCYFEVDVPPSKLETIDSKYDSCLFPDFLKELSSLYTN